MKSIRDISGSARSSTRRSSCFPSPATGSDTVTPQLYNVYEVVSNKYLTEKPVESGKSERDTTFYLNFDPVKAGAVGNEVLFTFTFPDGEKTGPATTYATMKPTQNGRNSSTA